MQMSLEPTLLEILDQPLYIMVFHSHCKVHCAAEEAALCTAQLLLYGEDHVEKMLTGHIFFKLLTSYTHYLT